MQWIYLAPQRVLAFRRDGVAAAVREAQEVDGCRVGGGGGEAFLLSCLADTLNDPGTNTGLGSGGGAQFALRGRQTTEAAAERIRSDP